MNNKEYIEEYITSRGLSNSTRLNLITVINNYTTFQQLTIQELLDEAEAEEEAGVRWKHRTLKKRLINYTNYVRETKSFNTAKLYTRTIKSFYRHHDILIGNLPRLNHRNININPPVKYEDLPTKEILKSAVEIAEPVMKCLLLFLSSTGMSKVDCLSLTIHDFINATSDYHTCKTITEILTQLKNHDKPIIPTWDNRRSKTNKYFVTFNTPETTDEIVNYLLARNEKKSLQFDDRLFKINKDYYTLKFEELNDALNLGNVGYYCRLRGHNLRKFHASNLSKAGMEKYKINILQGKSNNRVDSAYFFEDTEQLKKDYIDAMEGLLLFTDVHRLDLHSDEFKEMQDKYNDLKTEVDKILDWLE